VNRLPGDKCPGFDQVQRMEVSVVSQFDNDTSNKTPSLRLLRLRLPAGKQA
jgi:hypothetical protein